MDSAGRGEGARAAHRLDTASPISYEPTAPDAHAASKADGEHPAVAAAPAHVGEPQRRQALAQAAHALKTPLAVIKGSATTLLSSAGPWDPAAQQELLQLIDAQADRLHALVNELLAVWQADEMEQREVLFHSGALTIDFAQQQVYVAERYVPLSRTEYKLLRVLAEHVGRVLSHELLLERVWGPGYGQEVAFLWVYVRRLRRKIEPDPSRPSYIETIPGVGYRLAQH